MITPKTRLDRCFSAQPCAACVRLKGRSFGTQHSHLSIVRLEPMQFRVRTAKDDKVVSNLDVSEAVVSPTFRSTPWEAEEADKEGRSEIRIAFVSESNICRSVLAAGLMKQLLAENGLADEVLVASRATRDYTLGEKAHPAAVAAAKGLGLRISPDFQAQKFDYEEDTVLFDLILVMDKFTAADVMREISVFDTINRKGNYSQKVRRLGEFHPRLREVAGAEGQDIDDPLYGNEGGPLESEAVERTAVIIKEACEGMLDFFLQLKEESRPQASLCDQLRAKMSGMQQMDWLAPPMLSRR